MATIISADDIKKTLPGYKPELSGKFHRDSTRIADRKYTQVVKEPKIGKVILLSGGSAAGKTEYIAYLPDNERLAIFDGTLPTIEGFKIKLRAVRHASKKIEIHAVVPDDIKRAYVAFLGRERKYDEEFFYKTHSNSRATLLYIARHFPEIPITIVTSYFENGRGMRFKELEYSGRNKLIEYINGIQYTEEEIITIITQS